MHQKKVRHKDLAVSFIHNLSGLMIYFFLAAEQIFEVEQKCCARHDKWSVR